MPNKNRSIPKLTQAQKALVLGDNSPSRSKHVEVDLSRFSRSHKFWLRVLPRLEATAVGTISRIFVEVDPKQTAEAKLKHGIMAAVQSFEQRRSIQAYLRRRGITGPTSHYVDGQTRVGKAR